MKDNLDNGNFEDQPHLVKHTNLSASSCTHPICPLYHRYRTAPIVNTPNHLTNIAPTAERETAETENAHEAEIDGRSPVAQTPKTLRTYRSRRERVSNSHSRPRRSESPKPPQMPPTSKSPGVPRLLTTPKTTPTSPIYPSRSSKPPGPRSESFFAPENHDWNDKDVFIRVIPFPRTADHDDLHFPESVPSKADNAPQAAMNISFHDIVLQAKRYFMHPVQAIYIVVFDAGAVILFVTNTVRFIIPGFLIRRAIKGL
ncbi:hypothetical protein FZEAL_9773 [Fusarium zealandicum]|uniref:Uncharacterized protein n=1 Tax=Fusarium zealandicum TaxID=1053134 RepID=A0A8H4U8U2_9HYPO|nr:hypothetical protein FZEAL_9773 [Fusarium zealandicum]